MTMATRATNARQVKTVVDTRDPAVDVLKALSDPIRLGIMSRIASTDELPCTTLEQELPISKSTISYHMRILRGAGLIDIRKQGKFYHYTARSKEIDQMIPGLMSWLVKRSGA
jgi:DNA-binding transcriptional ArsR family regulator